MIFPLDLGNALANLYTTLRRDKELLAWLALFMCCFFSAWISGAGVMGGMLMADKPLLMAVGGGLSASAASVMGVLLRHPQGRKLLLSVPQSVVEKYQQGEGGRGDTVIGGSNGK